jgi:hypothetical protein
MPMNRIVIGQTGVLPADRRGGEQYIELACFNSL